VRAAPISNVLRHMRIVTAHTMIEDLRAHFERAGFLTTPDGEGAFVVAARDGRPAEEANVEVALMLRLWRTMHPETHAAASD
jgi:hypothetical protein